MPVFTYHSVYGYCLYRLLALNSYWEGTFVPSRSYMEGEGMMVVNSQVRLCQICRNPLPENAHKNTKYCKRAEWRKDRRRHVEPGPRCFYCQRSQPGPYRQRGTE